MLMSRHVMCRDALLKQLIMLIFLEKDFIFLLLWHFSFALSVCGVFFTYFWPLQHPTQKHPACKNTAMNKAAQCPLSLQVLLSSALFHLVVVHYFIFPQEWCQDYSNCISAAVYKTLDCVFAVSPTHCSCWV